MRISNDSLVLRELNHLCVLANLIKVEDMLDNVAKRILVIMLTLHPLLKAAVEEFFGRSKPWRLSLRRLSCTGSL